jgi:hypothetical protein
MVNFGSGTMDYVSRNGNEWRRGQSTSQKRIPLDKATASRIAGMTNNTG